MAWFHGHTNVVFFMGTPPGSAGRGDHVVVFSTVCFGPAFWMGLLTVT